MKKIGCIILVVVGLWACKGSNASASSSVSESAPTQSTSKTQETQSSEKQAQPAQKVAQPSKVVSIDPNNPPQIPVSKTPKGSQ